MAQIDRFLHLIDVLTGEENERHLSLDQLDFLDRMRISGRFEQSLGDLRQSGGFAHCLDNSHSASYLALLAALLSALFSLAFMALRRCLATAFRFFRFMMLLFSTLLQRYYT